MYIVVPLFTAFFLLVGCGFSLQAQTLDSLLTNDSDQRIELGVGSLDAAVTLSDGLTILGAGPDKSILVQPGPDQPALVVPVGATVTLSALSVIGVKGAAPLVFVKGGTLILSDCALSSASAVLVEIDHGSVFLTNCRLDGAGVLIAHKNALLVSLDQTRLLVNGGTAIQGIGSNLYLSQVKIEGFTGFGIDQKQGGSFVVEETVLQGSGPAAIFTASTNEITMRDVSIAGELDFGVFAKSATRLSIETLNTSRDIKTALTLQDIQTANLTHSHLAARNRGLEVSNGSGEIRIEDSTVSTTEDGEAVFLADASRVLMDKLQIESAGIGVFVSDGVEQFSFTNSDLESSGGYGFVLKAQADAAPDWAIQNATIRTGEQTIPFASFGNASYVVRDTDIQTDLATPFEYGENARPMIENVTVFSDSGMPKTAVQDPNLAGIAFKPRSAFSTNNPATKLAPQPIANSDSEPGFISITLKHPETGELTKTPLEMRPKSELAALWRARRPPNIWDHSYILRDGVDANAVAEHARAKIAKAAYDNDADIQARATKRMFRSQFALLVLLDQIIAAGNKGDVAVLERLHYELPAKSEFFYTLVRLEARLGLLDGGRSEQLVAQMLADLPLNFPTQHALRFLMRAGSVWAYDTGFEILQEFDIQTAPPEMRQLILMPELLWMPHDKALASARAMLASIKVDSQILVANAGPDQQVTASRSRWQAFPDIVMFLAANGTAEDLINLVLELPPQAEIAPTNVLFASPRSFVEAYYGRDDGPVRQPIYDWPEILREGVCNAALATDRTAASDASADIWKFLLPRIQVADGRDPNAPRTAITRGLDLTYGLIKSALLTECQLPAGIAGASVNAIDAQGFEVMTKFARPPNWWQQIAGKKEKVRSLFREPSRRRLDGLSPYLTRDILESAANSGFFDQGLAAIVAQHHSNLTNAYQPTNPVFSFGQEQRFARILEKTTDKGWAAFVHTGVTLVAGEGTLGLSIKINAVSEPAGVLAEIDAQEMKALTTAPHQKILKSIELDGPAGRTGAQFLGVSPGGRLLFQIPWDGVFTNRYLRLKMRFMKESWDFDIPLFGTELALKSFLETVE